MDKTITYELTDAMLRECFWHNQGRRTILFLLFFYGILAALVVLLALIFGKAVFLIVLCLVSIPPLLFSCWYFYHGIRHRNAFLKSMSSLPNRTHRCSFTEEQLWYESPLGESTWPWQSLKQLDELHNIWQFNFSGNLILLPSSTIDNELVSFLDNQARQYGVLFYRRGQNVKHKYRIQPPNLHIEKLVWFLLVSVTMILFYCWARTLGPVNRVVDQQFNVLADKAEMVPLRIGQGETFDLSGTVTFGDPVDVHLCRGLDMEDGKVLFKTAGLLDAEKVLTWQRKETWPHSTPAIVVITSPGWSKVSLKAKITPGP